MEQLILASASPRRREILTLLGLSFEVIPAKAEETISHSLPLDKAIERVARSKAEEVAALHPDRVVIGADTVVTVDGHVLGKPRDAEQACAMLRQLQGRQHEVITGVWVCCPEPSECQGFAERAWVEFYPMTQGEIADYVATGEPLDKAGAYGIQGMGLRYIRGIKGDFYTVMGLPASRLWHLPPIRRLV